MRGSSLVVALCVLASGCGIAWRPALVLSVSAVEAARSWPTEARVAERWDVRAGATLVVAPRAARRVLRPEHISRARRRTSPCSAAWLCAWERAARAEALARAPSAVVEASP